MTAKRLLAVTLAGGLIAAGAVLWLGSSAGAPSTPFGTLAFSSPEESDIVVAAADGSGLRRLTSIAGPQFDPSFSPDGRRIAYRDSRHGINRDDEIFSMFKRAHGEEVEGCGIGLAVCRKIVEAHGGAIWAEPATDAGTVMRFTVPAPSADSKPGHTAA